MRASARRRGRDRGRWRRPWATRHAASRRRARTCWWRGRRCSGPPIPARRTGSWPPRPGLTRARTLVQTAGPVPMSSPTSASVDHRYRHPSSGAGDRPGPPRRRTCQPESAGRRGDVPTARRRSARAFTASSAARTPRSRRFAAPPGATSAGPRCTCRSSRAAIRVARRRAPMRSARRASPAWWSPPMTRRSTPPGAASGSSATRASRWSSPTARSAARARLLNQPFRKHARTGRPWVLFKSAMSLDGKVATRKRRLEVDLGRRQP